ncbi:uncharacterized protein SPPG_04714 [Spizellomyces punctatus DAOM BR117]|uniref:U2 snRNP-associated SURP motif-containing protein n=1 Tax=Spizellomyces punctatus (strain DAOM BR117) TaxID=645134 RepID=A0A0L0HFX3_SPIPD|nr:uncharacterized protein SPPG_04714 [Spizellomyces punctatus DAOM BR117]KND00391.1 hypothetical protein SPPG_04714 [Spizellomyces punctatus DAOM BR117]|eukprot:XP_016608430.1 hypothetical protein SPPG_04714 [Spizellomyces punctatus DAOM BR117]
MSDKKPQKAKLPWGIDKPKPGSLKNISSSKLQAFSVGINKKTPFQRQKEEAELKKKKEDEEAAKVYAEFVAAFEDDASKPKGWVKGGTIVPTVLYNQDEADGSSKLPPKKTLYMPQPFVKAGASAPPPVRKPVIESEPEPEPPVPKSQRKRNLDMFLEELKREQEERDQRLKAKHARLAGGGEPSSDTSFTLRAAFEDKPGSHDTGDPETTNLYVGNISPAVDEERLCREFAQYGPIASVKIMWPRSHEEKERQRNCGFVSFMTRDDAANALKNLDGKELMGNMIRVGWGKAVAIPPKPVYVLQGSAQAPPSGLPFNAQISRSQGGFGAIPPPGSFKAATVTGNARMEVCVTRPKDQQTIATIHRMIERVIKYGPEFEAMIMDREADNPQFRFLFKNDSAEHVYYRWKLYSILQGDPKNKWPTDPFQMFDEGPVWLPPEIPFDEEQVEGDILDVSSESDESGSDVERPRHVKGPLTRIQRLRLENMLRKLNLERGLIGRIMVFCIKHADACEEIIDVITKSLLIQRTPVFPVKIARLYLVSDILHNSATPIPNAWKYRSGFERRLEEIFSHFSVVRRSIALRLRQEQMRKAVMNLLSIWDNWIIFPQEFTDKLREKFLEEEKESDTKSDLQSRLQTQKEQKTGVWALDEEDPRETEKQAASRNNNWVQNDEAAEGTGGWTHDVKVEREPIKFTLSKQEEVSKPIPSEGDPNHGVLDIDQEVKRFVDELESQGIGLAERTLQGEELRKRLLMELVPTNEQTDEMDVEETNHVAAVKPQVEEDEDEVEDMFA